MKRILVALLSLILLFSCSTTGDVTAEPKEPKDTYESILVKSIDDIRTTISVNGRLCTLTLSAVTGEKTIIVQDQKRYSTYTLSELPVGKDGRRYLYSTLGDINIILFGYHIYISIGTDWTETYIERDYLSPFIFATHA